DSTCANLGRSATTMAKIPAQRPGDDDKKIADANWLIDEVADAEAKAKAKANAKSRAASRPPTTPPTPSSRSKQSGGDADHSYDLAGGDGPSTGELQAVVPPIPVAAEATAPRRPRTEEPFAASTGPPATVDQVWSRGAEWGGSLTSIVIAAVVFGFLIYVALGTGLLQVAFFLMLAGAGAMLVLCYPLFITLERPVRITPEQAAKDYYHTLSHAMP